MTQQKPLFWLLDFEEGFNPFFSYDILTNLLGFFIVLRWESVPDVKAIPNVLTLESFQELIADWSVFDSQVMLKVKTKYQSDILRVLEHHSKNFLGGEKIVLFEERYEAFFQNIMEMNQKSHPMFVFEGIIRTVCALLENNILRSFLRWDFAQNLQFFDLRSNTAFFYINEQGYKPLKLRAVVSDLKIPLQTIQPQTPKKKTPSQARKMIKDPEDVDLIKALRHPRNWEL